MDDEIVTITGARYKRSDYMDETGIPSHGSILCTLRRTTI